MPLYAEARDRLFFRHVAAQLHFTRDGGGRVNAATLHQRGRQLTGRRTD